MYSRTADDTDGASVKPLPDDLIELARRAADDVAPLGDSRSFDPDAAIVNFYEPGARVGLHQDWPASTCNISRVTGSAWTCSYRTTSFVVTDGLGGEVAGHCENTDSHSLTMPLDLHPWISFTVVPWT